jgi:hypothetical protein
MIYIHYWYNRKLLYLCVTFCIFPIDCICSICLFAILNGNRLVSFAIHRLILMFDTNIIYLIHITYFRILSINLILCDYCLMNFFLHNFRLLSFYWHLCFYLRICRRSVLPYTRFCNCLLITITFYTLLTSLFCILNVAKYLRI